MSVKGRVFENGSAIDKVRLGPLCDVERPAARRTTAARRIATDGKMNATEVPDGGLGQHGTMGYVGFRALENIAWTKKFASPKAYQARCL